MKSFLNILFLLARGQEPPHHMRIIFMKRLNPEGQFNAQPHGEDSLGNLLQSLMPSPMSAEDSITQDIMRMMPKLDEQIHLLSRFQQDDCADDAQKLGCPTQIPSMSPGNNNPPLDSDSKYWKCMSRQRSSLSVKCRDSIKQHVPAMCHENAQLHCDGMDTGIIDCLNAHKQNLSPECRYALETTLEIIGKVNNSGSIALVDEMGRFLHLWSGPSNNDSGFSVFQFVLVLACLFGIWKVCTDPKKMAFLYKVVAGVKYQVTKARMSGAENQTFGAI